MRARGAREIMKLFKIAPCASLHGRYGIILIPPPTQPPIALCYCDLNHIIIALRYITLVIFYYHYLIFNFMPIIYSALNRGSRVRGNKGNGGKHVLPFFGTAPLAPSISPKCIFCVIFFMLLILLNSVYCINYSVIFIQ